MVWTWQVPWHLAPPLPYMWCHHRRQVKNLVILVIITILIISMIMMIVITIITMILTMMMFPQHAHCLCRPLHIWPPEELVPGGLSSPSLLPSSRSSSSRSWSSKPRWLPVLITSTPSCPRTRSRRGKWPTCGRWRNHHSCHHQGHEQTNPSKKPPSWKLCPARGLWLQHHHQRRLSSQAWRAPGVQWVSLSTELRNVNFFTQIDIWAQNFIRNFSLSFSPF